jgi:hypothetical protein
VNEQERPDPTGEPQGRATAPPAPGPVARASRADTTVAVLLAVAAVIVAAIGARAALVGDRGSDTWHTAIREDVKRAAAIVEDVRFLYQEEVRAALEVREAEVRGRELRRAARRRSGTVRELLEIEAQAQKQVAAPLRKTTAIATDPRYRPEEGGVLRRLADQRARHPDLVALDPDRTERRGSSLSLESAWLVAATLPAAIAFLLGALAEGFAHWRRALVPAGFAFAAVSLLSALVVEVSF